MSNDSDRERHSFDEELRQLVDLCNQGQMTALLGRANAWSELHPQNVILLNLVGAANAGLGHFEEAVRAYRQALVIAPGSASTHNNLGNALVASGDFQAAAASFSDAISFDRQNAVAHNNLGNALRALGRTDEALEYYQRAITLNAKFVDAHSNLGAALREGGDLAAAITSYRRALTLNPTHAEANYNLASALYNRGLFEEALEYYRKALQSRPRYVDAYAGLGSAQVQLGRIDLAIRSFQAALRINPSHAVSLSHLLYQRAHICEWNSPEIESGLVTNLGINTDAVQPFRILALEDAPERHLYRSRKYADSHFHVARPNKFATPKSKKERLSVGYFSSDFQNHATMYLAARLFELHDDSKFDIQVYSYGPQKNDEMQNRLRNSVSSFFDVKEFSDKKIAHLAMSNGVDIAVDLKGYTRDGRLGIFAGRVAPVQISWLGYPGTLGSSFMDYLIADETLIPENFREYYDEEIIYLPNSYQVNDNRRQISNRTFSKTELGLPETGFVFCCFNNNYKISNREFDVWARVLNQVDGSVLWLLSSNPWAERNLRLEAKKRGVDPSRIVFAGFCRPADHLARQKHADLFLDTFAVNAHTTASDALWAGLPVLTKMGKGFPSRVAASLLKSVGIPEMISCSEQEYEQAAVELATDRAKLSAIRARLAANLSTCPLFDSELFTRNIEQAYLVAYQQHLEGNGPLTFSVPDQSGK